MSSLLGALVDDLVARLLRVQVYALLTIKYGAQVE